MRNLYIGEVLFSDTRSRKKKSLKRVKKKVELITPDGTGTAELHCLDFICQISEEVERALKNPYDKDAASVDRIEALCEAISKYTMQDIIASNCGDFMKALACIDTLCGIEILMRTMFVIRTAHSLYDSSDTIQEQKRAACIEMLGNAEESARVSTPNCQYYIAIAARLIDSCHRGDGIYAATCAGWSSEDIERWDRASRTACPLCSPRVTSRG